MPDLEPASGLGPDPVPDRDRDRLPDLDPEPPAALEEAQRKARYRKDHQLQSARHHHLAHRQSLWGQTEFREYPQDTRNDHRLKRIHKVRQPAQS